MPKIITGQKDAFVLTTEVPRDTEDVDAIDVERPVQDLLNNDGFLYARQNALFARLDAVERLSAGFRLLSGLSALQIEPGSTHTYQGAVQIARFAGFEGEVNVTALNVPGGVSVTVNPNPVAGDTADVTVAASPQAVAGNYDILLQAEGGGKTALARISALVTAATQAPAFEVVGPSIAAIDRTAGASTHISLDVTRAGGFGDAITFEAAQLPAGVTCTFEPAAVGGSSPQQVGATTATLTVSNLVPAGRYTVVLRASGGGIVRTVSLTLGVSSTPALAGTPDYSLSLSYDAGDAGLINGATLIIDRSGGYTGPVVLAVAQLPDQGYWASNDEAYPRPVGPRPKYWVPVPAPRLLINGQLGSATVIGNTARITADGLSGGWQNSGVAPKPAGTALQWLSSTIAGADTSGNNRFASIDVRLGSQQ